MKAVIVELGKVKKSIIEKENKNNSVVKLFNFEKKPISKQTGVLEVEGETRATNPMLEFATLGAPGNDGLCGECDTIVGYLASFRNENQCPECNAPEYKIDWYHRIR